MMTQSFHKKQAGHKYSARKTVVDGVHFPSALEAQVYAQLKFRAKIGEIIDLVIHPSFQLTKYVRWKPDFKYYCLKRNETIVCEAKGVPTPDFIIKLNLWKEFGPHKLEIYRGSWKRPYLSETIIPVVGKQDAHRLKLKKEN